MVRRNMEKSKRYVNVDWFECYMAQFFCLFYLKNIENLRTARLKTIANMLLDHLDKDETPEDEEVFSPARRNLLVVILWLLGLKEEALEEAEIAMRAHPTNISARSNMAFILWLRAEEHKSYKILKGLKYCKTEHPEKCKELLITAETQTAYCYRKLGLPYTSHGIRRFRKIIEEKPNVDVWKYTLASNLQRTVHENSPPQESGITVSQAQTEAFDLLVIIKDNERNSKELRALAFSELGQILSFPKGDNIIAVQNKAERLELNAEKCFEYSLKLNGENTSILCRVGEFYRHCGDLQQSRDILEEAVRRKPTPTSHHQLGLTYKTMAAEMTAHKHFSRRDPFVTEALEQFLAALMQSSSETSSVAYDLGLMYKSLSEYSTALDVFQEIIELEEDDTNCIKAFEQSALVYLKGRTSNDHRSNQFKEMAHSMLRMAIVCQCHLFETYRKDHFCNKWIWQSFATIGENYKKTRLENVVVHEKRLLKLIKRYDNDLMVLKDIVAYDTTADDPHNANELKAKINEYIIRDQFEDGVVFLCLLKLTDQWRELSAWEDLDLALKVFVHGAKGMLIQRATACDSHASRLNSQAAKRIFRMAYGSRFDVMSENIISFETPQIIIVYDLSDESAGKCATAVQYLLTEVFGLKTICAPNYDPNVIQSQAGNKACQLLHIVTKQDLSVVFQRNLKEGLARCPNTTLDVKDSNILPNNFHPITRTQRHVLALLLGSDRMPDLLQEYPSLLWQPERLESFSDSQPMSRDAVNTICELFCFLLGISIKLDE